LYQIEETDSLDSIMSQCMYFGLSLARVGADFRGIIAPVFTRTIRQNFEGSLRRATKEFESQVRGLPKKIVSNSVNCYIFFGLL
jgi:Dor1-like family